MAKIWEVHFTTFSGNAALDSVGTQHLVDDSPEGYPDIVEPLPGFSVRKGIYLDNDGDQKGYWTYNISNARFYTGLYTKRSYVMWVRRTGSGDTNGSLWGDGSDSYVRSGFKMNGSNLNVVINNNFEYNSSMPGNEWLMLTMCVDKFAPRTRVYQNTTEIVSTTRIPSTNYSKAAIGDIAFRECDCLIAYCATYDHFLTVPEIENLYNSFLVDSNDPVNFPYGEVSGKIFDKEGSPLEQAAVLAIDTSNNETVARDTTTAGGNYTLQFPSNGTFAISAFKEGVIGGRVVQATVSGGTVTFDTD